MELLHPLRARRQRKINGKVHDVAGAVAASIFDSLSEEETGPYHVEIGRKPYGITAEEYLERVRTMAIDSLGRVGCADAVEYDPLGTEKASTHTIHPTDSGQGPVVEWDEKNLQVVFRQPEPALAN